MISSNPYIIVFGHGRAEAIVRQHFSFWLRHGGTLEIISPYDDMASTHPSCQNFYVGKSSHHSPENIVRLRYALDRLNNKRDLHDSLWLFEYDSICLSTFLPKIPPDEIWATVFIEANPGFRGPGFAHVPIGIGTEAITRLADVANELGDGIEQGFPDRAIALYSKRANEKFGSKTTMVPFGRSYSQNTIEPQHHEQLYETVSCGCEFIHGIKDPKTLAVILNAREYYLG